MRRLASVLTRGPMSRSTTIVSIRRGNKVSIIGDQQVTAGNVVYKGSAQKVRLFKAKQDDGKDAVTVGFAGATSDCLTLITLLEEKKQEYPGQLMRACIELAKKWRGDRALRQLNASLIVVDYESTFVIDGTGNVLTPDVDGISVAGSGGYYAKAAALAYLEGCPDMPADEICKKSLKIAASTDVYTNTWWDMLTLTLDEDNKVVSSTETNRTGENARREVQMPLVNMGGPVCPDAEPSKEEAEDDEEDN